MEAGSEGVCGKEWPGGYADGGGEERLEEERSTYGSADAAVL